MKARVLVIILLGFAAGGCQTDSFQMKEEFAWNRNLVEHYRDDSVANAIVAQRTIYPYHFETGSAELNELGRYDLRIMAERLGTLPAVTVSLQQPETQPELNQRRMAAARAALVEFGMNEGRLTLAEKTLQPEMQTSQDVHLQLLRLQGGEQEPQLIPIQVEGGSR